MKPPSDQRRDVYGRLGQAAGPRKPGSKIQPRTDWTHLYYTERGRRASLQGMRCKILWEIDDRCVRVEFEKGDIVVVQKDSLKELPR